MKIKMKEIVKLAATFLQSDNVLKCIDCYPKPCKELDADELASAEKELNLLLRCANLTLCEIAADYFPLKTKQIFNTDDGQIKYCEFSKTPVDIYKAEKSGNDVKFRLFTDFMTTACGAVTVLYTYLPKDIALTGSLNFEPNKADARIAAYGTAAEYCLISSLYEEALMWDKRYKDSLMNAKRSVKGIKIPARRWH